MSKDDQILLDYGGIWLIISWKFLYCHPTKKISICLHNIVHQHLAHLWQKILQKSRSLFHMSEILLEPTLVITYIHQFLYKKLRNAKCCFLRQLYILTFLCHKSAINCQIDSRNNRMYNSSAAAIGLEKNFFGTTCSCLRSKFQAPGSY